MNVLKNNDEISKYKQHFFKQFCFVLVLIRPFQFTLAWLPPPIRSNIWKFKFRACRIIQMQLSAPFFPTPFFRA